MVTKYTGGQVVKRGIYWSSSSGEFVAVPRDGGRLEGGADDRYFRSPQPLVLVLGPLMGLAYALFLPISGLLVLIPYLLEKMRTGLFSRKLAAAHVAGSMAQPGISYLEPHLRGQRRSEPADAEDVETAHMGKLVDLASEVAAKRWQAK